MIFSNALRVLLALFAFAFAPAMAAEPAEELKPTPMSAKGVEVISVEQAKALLGKAQFFDLRAAVNYGRGHIKGAVAIPYDQKSAKSENFDASLDRFDMAKLPKDKSAPIVFYSDAPTGWKSYKAAIVAAKAGYTSVKWMRDGTAGWSAKGLPLE